MYVAKLNCKSHLKKLRKTFEKLAFKRLKISKIRGDEICIKKSIIKMDKAIYAVEQKYFVNY